MICQAQATMINRLASRTVKASLLVQERIKSTMTSQDQVLMMLKTISLSMALNHRELLQQSVRLLWKMLQMTYQAQAITTNLQHSRTVRASLLELDKTLSITMSQVQEHTMLGMTSQNQVLSHKDWQVLKEQHSWSKLQMICQAPVTMIHHQASKIAKDSLLA